MRKDKNITDLTVHNLDKLVQKAIKDQLASFRSINPNTEVMTKLEAAKFFKVDISTITNWTDRGVLKPYGVESSSRVFFLKSDLIEALTPIR